MLDKFTLSKGAATYMKAWEAKGKNVLIITDTTDMIHAGEIFAREAQAAGAEVTLAIIPPRMNDGERAPPIIEGAAKAADFRVTVCKYVLTIRGAPSAWTTRTPPISEGRVERVGEFNTTFDDLREIHERNARIIAFFKDKDQVHVTSADGTDLTVSVKGREWFNNLHYTQCSLYEKEGWSTDWGKDFKFPDMLAYAEATCAPVPGSTNGTYVVNDWMSGSGNVLLQEPVILKIKDGRVVEITGGREAQRLKELVEKSDQYAVNIGEFAFGTGHTIKDPRGDHADKAIIGGMHLGLGTTLLVGTEVGAGGVQSGIHCDGVSLGVTVETEGQIVLKDNKFWI